RGAPPGAYLDELSLLAGHGDGRGHDVGELGDRRRCRVLDEGALVGLAVRGEHRLEEHLLGGEVVQQPGVGTRPAHPLGFLHMAESADYFPELPGGTAAGRAMEPAPFDARTLGEARARVRPRPWRPRCRCPSPAGPTGG